MPNQEPQQPRRNPFRRGGAGDSVAASVQNSQNVTVGKNIIQIGALVIPVIPVVALLVVIVGSLAVWLWLQNRGPITMRDGAYNIAVVNFADPDKARGQQLSTWIAKSLDKLNASSDQGSANALVWYESLQRNQMATSLGVIDGATDEARRIQASALAERIHANLVIYGVVGPDNTLLPEFFVANQASDEATWLAGVHQLGDRPVYVDGPQDRVEGDLSDRARTLWWLTRALRFASFGESSRAYDMLAQATATTDPIQSREILLEVQGEAALFTAQKIWNTNPDQFDHYVRDAEQAFRAALAVKPTYVRAVIGLGSVARIRATLLLTTTPISTTRQQIEPLLDAAIAQYTAAQQLAPTAFDHAWSQVVPGLALGGAYRSQGDMFAALAYDARNNGDQIAAAGFEAQAETAIDQAVANLTPGIEPLQQQGELRLLGQTYLSLGNAMSQKSNLRGFANDANGQSLWAQQASVTYQQCIDLTKTKDGSADRILSEQVGTLCQQGKQRLEP